MPKKVDAESVATLTLRGMGDFTKESRKKIAGWLREQAKAVIKEGDNYAKRYRARYYNIKD